MKPLIAGDRKVETDSERWYIMSDEADGRKYDEMSRKYGLEDHPIEIDARSETRERSLYPDKNRNIRVVFVSDAMRLDVGDDTDVVRR
jgi:hypothetical protein